MRLPDFLPETLTHYQKAENDAELFSLLSKNALDLTHFFEYACADEPWCEAHSEFIKSSLTWLTTEFLKERLTKESAERVVRSIHAHFPILQSLIPSNITFRVKGHDIEVNSLLFGVGASFFRDLMRFQIHEKRQKCVICDDLSAEMFQLVNEFFLTGDIRDLWKREESFLFEFLRMASRLRMQKLALLCEETLKRYVTRSNALDVLVTAHKESWFVIKEKCYQILNQMSLGVYFEDISKSLEQVDSKVINPFYLKFLEFRYTSLEVFAKLKSFITHLAFSGSLTQEEQFIYTIQSCPKLVALDIGGSTTFSDKILEIPSHLEQLDLSSCIWLSNDYLKQIIAMFPSLTRLSINSNMQLTYNSWKELQKLSQLVSLDISRCHQVSDEDFSLILRACPNLIELNVQECTKLTEKAFYELAKSLPHLIHLNVSRCHITDGVLAEFTMRLKNLKKLNVERCIEVTERGLNQALKYAYNLNEIKGIKS